MRKLYFKKIIFIFPLVYKGDNILPTDNVRFVNFCLHFHLIFQILKNNVFWYFFFFVSVWFFFLCSEKAPLTISAQEDVKIVYYRALYPFESRSHDEITIQPGDIVMVRRDWDITWKNYLSFLHWCDWNYIWQDFLQTWEKYFSEY